MDARTLQETRDRLASEHGPWIDSLPLGNGLQTTNAPVAGEGLRMQAILQAAADSLGRPLDGSRVLDLGAAEATYAVEFARHGAEVVAIEGRRGNIEKARFVKDALELDGLEIVHADVRELSRARFGEFDVVLCLGLLYHLDGPAAVELVHRIAEVTRRTAIVDTHVALRSRGSVPVVGGTYRGRRVREFDPSADEREQESLSRSAVGNPESLWLTRPSLFNLLGDAGFTSVTELRVPRHEKPADRMTLLAFRGEPRAVVTAQVPEAVRWPEHERTAPHPNQTWRGALKLRLAPLAPARLKTWARQRRDPSGPSARR